MENKHKALYESISGKAESLFSAFGMNGVVAVFEKPDSHIFLDVEEYFVFQFHLDSSRIDVDLPVFCINTLLHNFRM